MSKKKHEWTRKGVTASMAVVLAFGMVPAMPGVALAVGENDAVASEDALTSDKEVAPCDLGSVDSWITDRTEPQNFEIKDGQISFGVSEQPGADSWYGWQGRKAYTGMEVSDYWRVSYSFEVSKEMLEKDDVNQSLWIQVDEAGENGAASQEDCVDWSIVQFKNEDTTAELQAWNSEGEGKWNSVLNSPTAGYYEVTTEFFRGTIYQYVNGELVNHYAVGAEKTAPVALIAQGRSYGKAFNVKMSVPEVSSTASKADSEASLRALIAEGDSGDTISLSKDIELTSKLTIDKKISVDGCGNAISAHEDFYIDKSDSASTNGTKHLIGIEGTAAGGAELKNVTLDSKGEAFGLQPYKTGETPIQLDNVTLLNSAGTGLTVNGASVTATGLTVDGSAWGQSIDVSNGAGVKGYPTLILSDSHLLDPIGVFEDIDGSTDAGNGAVVQIDKVSCEKYPVEVKEGTWKLIYAPSCPITVGNAGYWNLAEAIRNAESGSTIEINSDCWVSQKVSIDKSVKIDGNGHVLTGIANNAGVYFEVVNGEVTFQDMFLRNFGGDVGTVNEQSLIKVPSTANDSVDLHVDGVKFSNFNRSAIDVNAGTFDVANCAIDCENNSPSDSKLTKGVMAAYDAKGTVRNTSIENPSSGYNKWTTAGIEVWDSAEVTVEACRISNAPVGVYAYVFGGEYGDGAKAILKGNNDINARDYAVMVGFGEQNAAVSVDVYGGKYIGDLYVGEDDGDSSTELTSDKAKLSISGGEFSVDPSDYIVSGYCTSKTEGGFVVNPIPAPPSGGSSSAGQDETVTENPDGSTTTTVTEEERNDDGSTTTTVTETTEGREDGSTTEKVTETTVFEDGSKVVKVTETNTLEDGTSATTVVEDGVLASASAKVTREVVEAAGGGAVVLPFAEPVEAKASGEAVEIEVEAPAKARIAVPVAKAEGEAAVAPGAVLVLVDAEGVETVLPKTANDGEALSAEIPGDCTLKVVDASADFPDVSDDAWYAKQGVDDFVSARGVMTGVEVAPGSFEFQGDEPTNRGMFVTMLHRLESEPAVDSEGFADVAEGSWYAGSSEWAVEAGIATGYLDAEGNATFDGDGGVTREQMATFLFRYAQWLGLDTSARADREIEGVSEFAEDAMSWAVAEGLVKGDDDTGAIRPGDGATRAEAAVVVMRMIDLMA